LIGAEGAKTPAGSEVSGDPTGAKRRGGSRNLPAESEEPGASINRPKYNQEFIFNLRHFPRYWEWIFTTVDIIIKIGKESIDLSEQQMFEQVQDVLDKLRPFLLRDGGDCELVDVEDGIVKLRLLGACGSCPSSTITLKAGIERALLEEVPGVVEVEQVF
jgi:Fe-S cluster biogenesis protein NfuA